VFVRVFVESRDSNSRVVLVAELFLLLLLFREARATAAPFGAGRKTSVERERGRGRDWAGEREMVDPAPWGRWETEAASAAAVGSCVSGKRPAS
jgi:hypothetical protein